MFKPGAFLFFRISTLKKVDQFFPVHGSEPVDEKKIWILFGPGCHFGCRIDTAKYAILGSFRRFSRCPRLVDKRKEPRGYGVLLVRLPRLELGTSSLSGMRSNLLSYNRPSASLDTSATIHTLSITGRVTFEIA